MPKKDILLDAQYSDWFNRRWRPAAAWVYMAICILDFAIFPIFLGILQSHQGVLISQWVPMTLQGGGLFHVSFGAILGVSAWSRGREKMTAMEYDYQGYQGSYGINSNDYSNSRGYTRYYDVRNEVEGSNENR